MVDFLNPSSFYLFGSTMPDLLNKNKIPQWGK
jgi:hypothetical protein